MSHTEIYNFLKIDHVILFHISLILFYERWLYLALNFLHIDITLISDHDKPLCFAERYLKLILWSYFTIFYIESYVDFINGSNKSLVMQFEIPLIWSSSMSETQIKLCKINLHLCRLIYRMDLRNI